MSTAACNDSSAPQALNHAATAACPLAFFERLATLVPKPRTHLLTYHGVLAPAAQLECPGSSRSDESRRRISVVAKGIPTASCPGRARGRNHTTVRPNAMPSARARALPTSTPRSRTQPEPAGSVGPSSQRPSVRRRRSHVSRLRRCAQADRHDHRRARRAQDPRATSSCPAQPRRALLPERRQSPSSPGSAAWERAAHLQRGAVWRRRAPRRKPSDSGRLRGGSRGCPQHRNGAPRDRIHSSVGSRPTGNRPEALPSVGVIRLEFLSPELARLSTRLNVRAAAYALGHIDHAPCVGEDGVRTEPDRSSHPSTKPRKQSRRGGSTDAHIESPRRSH